MSEDPPRPQRPDHSLKISRRTLLGGAALAAAALGIYATEIERHFIEIVPQTFLIPNLPETFRGFRIVQMSDIHLEWYTEDFFLRHAVNKINELAPDLVLLTGDYITNNSKGPDTRAYDAMPHCGEILRQLKCPLRFGILGNHDAHVDSAAVVDMLRTHGITPLVNQHVPVERDGRRFWLAGLDDIEAGTPDLDLAVPANPDGPVILMCHEPDFTDTIVSHHRGSLVDLVLAGHTHGGQVRLPFYGPLILPPLGEKYVQGRFRFNRLQLYVNRGIGVVALPVRFDCLPEITHITLQPAPRSAI